MGKIPVLTVEEEKQLLSSATKRAEMGVCFSKRNFLGAAGALAKKRGFPLKMVHPRRSGGRCLKRGMGGG